MRPLFADPITNDVNDTSPPPCFCTKVSMDHLYLGCKLAEKVKNFVKVTGRYLEMIGGIGNPYSIPK